MTVLGLSLLAPDSRGRVFTSYISSNTRTNALITYTNIMDSVESYANASFTSEDENTEKVVPAVMFSQEVMKRNEPVQLVSIKPLVEHHANESSAADVEQSSRRAGRDFSKYNWKQFLPITRR